MKSIYCAQTVRQMDEKLIQEFGMPSHSLMEIAAKSIAEEIQKEYPKGSIRIYCGPGNNGGDGLACARWLHLWGRKVEIRLPVSPKTKDAALNLKMCIALGIIPNQQQQTEADIHVDALLGNNQKGPPRGAIETEIHLIKAAQENGGTVIAIDLPSGLDPDKGHPFGSCWVKPNATLSLGYFKPGLFNACNAGKINNVDIGLSALSYGKKANSFQERARLIEEHDIIEMLPKEQPDSAKWNRGHVAIMANGGAAVLAAKASFSAGAGLVTLLAPKSQWAKLIGLPPEVILTTPENLNPKRHDSLVIGPGWGTNNGALFADLWINFPGPMVVDADALTLLANSPLKPSLFNRVLTPHIAEAARLLNIDKQEIAKDPWSAIEKLNQIGFSILKGPYTKIGCHPTWINPTGDWRLATAGTGDVLAGLIGALLAKGLDSKRACAVACFWHGAAGEKLQYGDSASDLFDPMTDWISRIKSLSPFRQ